MAFPLYGGLAPPDRASRVVAQLKAPDMWTPWGVRSTSSTDPRYTNINIIVPYSNWRGPVWIISNVLLCYGLMTAGFRDDAVALGESIVRLLAEDLGREGSWHECYDSDNGNALAAPGFLSWNVLAADLLDNLRAGVNPFAL